MSSLNSRRVQKNKLGILQTLSSLRVHIRDQASVLSNYPVGFLTLEMRYMGEDRESLLPYCYAYKTDRKLGWTCSTDMVVEVMLE